MPKLNKSMENLNKILDDARVGMEKALEHLSDEMGSVRAGRANASLVNNIQVEAYGATMPLPQTANVSTPDPKTIMIKPWDKTVLDEIERAIMASNIGLTPQNDGEQIRLNIPPLTEERRKDLVKQIKAMGENTKVSIRNIRRDAIQDIGKIAKEESISEDTIKGFEADVQDITNEFSTKADKYVAAKEEEVLKV